MTSFDNVNVLRERNRHLLRKLRQQGEILQRLTVPSRPPSDTNQLTETGNEELSSDYQRLGISETGAQNSIAAPCNLIHDGNCNGTTVASDSVLTLAVGQQGLARAALGRPKTHEAQAPFIIQSSDQDMASQSQLRQPLRSSADSGLLDKASSCLTQSRKMETSKPVAQDLHREQCDERRRTVDPLLGYDWIAGLLDAESSLTDHSEQFFTELRTFRQVNREECVHSPSTGAVEGDLSPPSASDEKDLEHTPQAHKCLFRYRINSRLFPAPLDAETTCPLCKVPKAKHLHSMAEPAFIRISVPRSTLLPAYRYRAQRRRSFDPSDSLGLPSVSKQGMCASSPSCIVWNMAYI